MEQVKERSHQVILSKLRVRNFQSIVDITINFDGKGVYHFNGLNNIGKSALIKAIKSLLQNVSNVKYSKYLRDDCDTFIVEGWFEDGNYIKLSRGATDYYAWNIDGVKGRLDKTKGKVPLEVEKYLNLYTDNEKSKESLNIRLPRNRLLFVDTSAGDNYFLLQKALGTEDFLLAMKLGTSKKNEIKKEIKLANKYLKQAEDEVTVVKEDLDVYIDLMESIDKLQSTIDVEYDNYCDIEDMLVMHRNLAKTQQELKEIESQLKVKELKELTKEYATYDKLKQTYKAFRQALETNKELKDMKKRIVSKGDEKELKSAIKELKLVEQAYKAYERKAELEQELKEQEKSLVSKELMQELTEEIENLNKISKTYKALVKAVDTKKELASYKYEATKKGYKGLEKELEELRKIKDMYESHQKLEQLEAKRDADLKAYEEADKGLAEFMRENNYCPIVAKTKDHKCPFDKDFFMEVLK